MMAEPSTTYALLVGVEQYAAEDWNLNGPANDVLKFTEWLRRNDVPPENITVLLSPGDENADIAKEVAIRTNIPRAATAEEVNKAISELQSTSASLFFLFWGGHGLIATEGERRLLCADAESNDLKNLNLDSLMRAMRTNLYQGIPRQIFVIDACANYLIDPEVVPPNTSFSEGFKLPSHEQFALFAAKPGEYAKNLDGEKTGLLSRELLAKFNALPKGDSWPPDMEAVMQALRKRFITLREQNQAEQTPTYFWTRDWADGEGRFGEITPDPSFTALKELKLPRKLNVSESIELRQSFLVCRVIKNSELRDSIILDLRPEIYNNLEHSDIPNVIVANLIDICRNYEGGFGELLTLVSSLEKGSTQVKNLWETAYRILPEEMPVKKPWE